MYYEIPLRGTGGTFSFLALPADTSPLEHGIDALGMTLLRPSRYRRYHHARNPHKEMRMPVKKGPATAVRGKRTDKVREGFSAEERAAMKERVRETKAAARRGGGGDDESAVLAKIAQMQESDRAKAQRLHAIIKASAPALAPKLWYGMPAYAKDDKVVCFFQSAQKFKTRYATIGFSDKAKLDDGPMWPTAFALKELSAAEEARISALVKKAVGETKL